MNRRHFLKSSVATAFVAGVTPAALSKAQAQTDQENLIPKPYLVLRRYQIKSEDNKKVVAGFLENAALPALSRLGIGPVGVFYEMPDSGSHDIYSLVPFASLDQFAALGQRVGEDGQFVDHASEYLNTEKSNPAYERFETTLFRSFAGYPWVRKPRQGDRIFELRTYESHNEMKALLKVEMFNEAELEIFRKVNLDGVFYGQALIGPGLPRLTYMLAYKDMEERERNWKAFLNHPDWDVLKKNQRYKDTVSKITSKYLVPAPYSQV